jgi:hypothetical protein
MILVYLSGSKNIDILTHVKNIKYFKNMSQTSWYYIAKMRFKKERKK